MYPLSPKSERLRELYWRSEILRAVYWLRGEGYGDVVDADLVEQCLGLDAASGRQHLDRMVDDGLLVRDGAWYALSSRGLQEGEEEFATAFSDLLKPAVAECGPECWCRMSPDEAEACAGSRARQVAP